MIPGMRNLTKGSVLTGKIIKSLSGFYYVVPTGNCRTKEGSDSLRQESSESGFCGTEQLIFTCRAKGVFRSLHVKPLVGDNCEFEITDLTCSPPEGSVVRILPRKNELIRPMVANVDQALLLFAISHPMPSCNMLDRFLIIMKQKKLPAVICFNKTDLAFPEQIRELSCTYENCGCRVFFASNRDGNGWPELDQLLLGKTTVITGPSGAGKSTLINRLCPDAAMETGELSRKIARGKNTTRHVEILQAPGQTFLIDTPGFTSLYLEDLEAEDLKDHYEEFGDYAADCRFHGCNHIAEPDCGIKEAVRVGEISSIRYRNYCEIFEDLKSKRPDYTKKKY